MTERESDDADAAPLPPYERSWRHPAELAAQQRDEYQRAAAPPPLSRRSRAYVGSFAAVVCAAVLSVSLPKGVDDTARDTGTGPTTIASSTSLPIKGFAVNPALVVTGSYGVTSALPVGNGYLLTALEDVTSQDEVWVTLPSGEEVEASIVDTDANTGLALLGVNPSDRNRIPRSVFGANDTRAGTDVPFDPAVLEGARLIDYDGDQPAATDDGVLTTRDGLFHIVTSPREVSGVAAVVGRDDATIGIAVRKAQATWVVPLAELWAILNKVFGLAPPGR